MFLLHDTVRRVLQAAASTRVRSFSAARRNRSQAAALRCGWHGARRSIVTGRIAVPATMYRSTAMEHVFDSANARLTRFAGSPSRTLQTVYGVEMDAESSSTVKPDLFKPAHELW